MSLALVGASQDLRHLAGCVLSYEDLLKSETPQLVAIDSIQEEITWSIDNKYYSADVRFSFHSVEGGFPENISQHDGIVVIVPHGDDEFSAENMAKLSFPDEDKLRLLVHFNNGDTTSDKIESYVLLAVDHGFEFVEISVNALTADHNSREKFGLPRLIEALQSHMWPTMRRKPKAVSAPSVVPTTEVNPPPASIPLEAEEISTHPPKAPAVTDSDSVNPLMPPNPFLDADGEMPGMEELLQTMMQAQAFRDQASSGSISDEDRRNQAAHFAMKLMELLNLGDDDDEEN